MDASQEVVGQRIREIRSWRQMTLESTADLAGLSYGYLGEIECGEKPVTKRGVLETLATALRVSPAELTGRPWTRSDPITSDSHEALAPRGGAGSVRRTGRGPGRDRALVTRSGG